MISYQFRVSCARHGVRVKGLPLFSKRGTGFILMSQSKLAEPATVRTGDLHSNWTLVSSIPSVGVSFRSFHNTRKLLKDYPEYTLFPMPALSPTMDSGSIREWNKQEGDSFSAGEVLCSIETDKASMDFEAQDDGILAKILVAPNSGDIPIGTPICVIVEDPADVAAFADFAVEDGGSAAAAAAAMVSSTATEAPAKSPASPTAETVASPNSNTKSSLMPSARHLSESKGVDATVLAGTGKGGRVTKGDVLQALASGVQLPPLTKSTETAVSTRTAIPDPVVSAAPPATRAAMGDVAIEQTNTMGSFEDVPNNKMRKVIASRLTESKREVPHFYTSVEVSLDNVLSLRKKLAKDHDVKVSVNDLVIRCCALALRDVPEVNASYDPKTGTVQLQPTIDVSVAVATPTGLITPIVPNTDKMGLSEITATIRDLALRARDGKLQPHEYQGGTFCVSNLGMFGINEFSAVINPPQAAILAVGGGTRKLVPMPYIDGADVQPKPSIQTIMTARLSSDRRVVDEATASLFLSAFRHYITKPETLML